MNEMPTYKFHIDTDTIDGLARISEKYGSKLTADIMHHWMASHQMVPGLELEYKDDFAVNKNGILIPARIFTQEHDFFR